MRKSNQTALRALLREHQDGLTVAELVKMMGGIRLSIMASLKCMPDAYIDRWEGPVRGQYAAVWCAVVPPPNCPHPNE